jgi:hypothetical protein
MRKGYYAEECERCKPGCADGKSRQADGRQMQKVVAKSIQQLLNPIIFIVYSKIL